MPSDSSAGRCAANESFIFVPTSSPSKLLRFSTVTNTRDAAQSLAYMSAAAVALRGGFAYVAHRSTSAAVSKVDVSGAMTLLATLVLSNLGEDIATAIVADNSDLYVSTIGDGTSPSIICKIDILTFARPVTGPVALTLNAGESKVKTLAFSPALDRLFACTSVSPDSICVRIDLNSFSRVDGTTLTGVESVIEAVHDTLSPFLLCAADSVPGKIAKVSTSPSMALVATVTLQPGVNPPNAFAFLPSDSAHFYVWLSTGDTRVLRMRRRDLVQVGKAGAAATGDGPSVAGGAVVVNSKLMVVTEVTPLKVVVFTVPSATATSTRSRTVPPPPPRQPGRGLVRRSSFAFAAGDGSAWRSATDNVSIFFPTSTKRVLRYSVSNASWSGSVMLGPAGVRAIALYGGYGFIVHAGSPSKISCSSNAKTARDEPN